MSSNLPVKNREQQWSIWDSARLNDFEFRSDDIMIGSWAKSGTTWLQQLVGQLIFKGDPEIYGQMLSPWPEFRISSKEDAFAMAEAQTHRRFLKTHSPLNAVPFDPTVKYLFIGRDVRDVMWSMYHHHCNLTPGAYEILNNMPGLIGPPLTLPNCDVHEYFQHFLEHGYLPGFSPEVEFWSTIQSWWDARQQPNVKILHYNNLKNDFAAQAQSVADFLEIEITPELWPQIIKHCEINHMRELASSIEMLDQIFEGGGATFINKGTNKRWKDILSSDEIDQCDEIASQQMSTDCAHWLKTGEI